MGPQGHPQGWHPSAPRRPAVGLDRWVAFPGGVQADLPPGARLSEALAALRFPQMPAPMSLSGQSCFQWCEACGCLCGDQGGRGPGQPNLREM